MGERPKDPPSIEDEKPSISDDYSALRKRRSSLATDKEARQGMLASDAGMAFVSEVDGKPFLSNVGRLGACKLVC